MRGADRILKIYNPFYILDTCITWTRCNSALLESTLRNSQMDLETERRLRKRIVKYRAAQKTLNSAYGYLAGRAALERGILRYGPRQVDDQEL